MTQRIIAIGREYGSGGHEIATIISEKLGIPMYDRNMLDHMAEKNGIDVNELMKHEESKRFALTRSVRGYTTSVQEHVAQIQFDFIKQKAESGESFVVVGRCAESVLRDNPNMVSIFVRGEEETKIERIMKLYNLDRTEAKNKIHRHDKKRKAYHNYYSDFKWGDSRGYDMCINSSVLGVERSAEALFEFIKGFLEE